MMKIWVLTFIIVFIGCNPKVVSYINPQARLDQFETYRIVSAQETPENGTPEHGQISYLIKSNIQKHMEKRLYKASNVTPDLTLRYEVISSTRVEHRTTSQSQFNSRYATYQPITSRTIQEAVLILELSDMNKKLVWQGSYDMKQERKVKKIPEAVEKAVDYIFTSYPYYARSSEEHEALKTTNHKKKTLTK